MNIITKIVFSDLEDKFSKLSVSSSSRIINIDRSYESVNGDEVPSRQPRKAATRTQGGSRRPDTSKKAREAARDGRPWGRGRGGGSSREPRAVASARNRAEVAEQGPGQGLKNVTMKNAVMMLNEMFPPPGAPQYKVVSMTGTPNNPTFEMTCSLMDQSFTGSGRSKKEAKLAASQFALEKLFGKDFTQQSCGQGGHGVGGAGGAQQLARPPPEVEAWMELEGKNPVSILNELHPGVMFSLVSAEGPSHAPEFCVTASLAGAGLVVEGRGGSKKEAKLHASKALLVHIHQVGFDPMTGSLKSNNEASGKVLSHILFLPISLKYEYMFVRNAVVENP